MQGIDIHKLAEALLYQEKDPLFFNSAFFMLFFGLFLLVYVLSYQINKLRVYLLTFFSLYFFYKTCGWYVGFILLAAFFDYNISHTIYSTTNKNSRKKLLVCSIIANVGLLFYFKYTNFFLNIANDFAAHKVHPLKLILPVGISFYTFENLSYTIDVYKGVFKPVRKFIDYLFFLSFFPKLLMGPIVRAADFVPQIHKKPVVTNQQVGEGLYLITAGIIKKVIISDYINANYVINIFDNPGAHTGIECLLAVYGYPMVIYCDFSGYSDMAIGMAKWMGFDININFLSPYQSATIGEFWKRWHISLASWLKDYVYIPLGGNKEGKFNTYKNLMITMLLGGFWHGASWNFLFWGALQGTALIAEKLRTGMGRQYLLVLPWSAKATRVAATIITFHFVCLGWVFFRCDTFSNSWVMLGQIAGNFHFNLLKPLFNGYKMVFVMLFIAMVLHGISFKKEGSFRQLVVNLPLPLKIIYFFLCIYIAIQFKQAEIIKPIYLQF
ncbi:MBOAT family O-acyltransferase [Parasediminibacterium sp. JCM 36343]|uniref:MBOAT family O-acyltransferase n=1 Tax=Parasediminibacterium sp. JCM 36343 TaxID=3374279 RepID=UPI00397BDEAB